MGAAISANGSITTCMVMASTSGGTGVAMKVIILWTKSMATVYTSGQMAASMKAIGRSANNTDKVSMYLAMEKFASGSGTMANASSGL